MNSTYKSKMGKMLKFMQVIFKTQHYSISKSSDQFFSILVGANYALAELRKSPTGDGKVERNAEGLEIRKQTKLTAQEEEAIRKIVLEFRQNVCGIDILRAENCFYVCDVNGWSAVKGNSKYYDDCAQNLKEIFLQNNNSAKDLLRYTLSHRKLIGMIGVLRHGDRTPKQKVKLVLSNRKILDLFGISNSFVSAPWSPIQFFFYFKIQKEPKQNLKIKSDTGKARLNKLHFILKSLLASMPIEGIKESVMKKPFIKASFLKIFS